jgi:hypothetical protein
MAPEPEKNSSDAAVSSLRDSAPTGKSKAGVQADVQQFTDVKFESPRESQRLEHRAEKWTPVYRK